MKISTSDTATVSTYLRKIKTPQSHSHKGQNGKVLIIGGSSLFHGAVLWSAEAASQMVDMVHVVSTNENSEIIKSIKTMWQTGMVVPQKDTLHYAEEDAGILIGNGMMRSVVKSQKLKIESKTWEDVLSIKDEGRYTREVVYYLITHFPDKQFIFDAGALQMMDEDWLKLLNKKAIITPHQQEFQTLFSTDLTHLSLSEKKQLTQKAARDHSCIILLKAVDDIITDGNRAVLVEGGNAGLTKGGTGDILAGLVAGMSATSDPFSAAIAASLLLKKTADELYKTKGYWYTAKDILASFPSIFHSLTNSPQD